MTTDIWQQPRPKRRQPYWSFKVTDADHSIFHSRQVSLRLQTHDAASWVARLVCSLQGPGKPLEWQGDLNDDCSAISNEIVAHAEHLYGPRRGGTWYCSVYGPGLQRYFHTADMNDIQPRSGRAARWLCELVISSVHAGLIEAYTD